MERYGNVAIRHVKLPCGKPKCKSCPHGPYFYLVVWHKGKSRQTYLGKKIFSDRTRKRQDLEVLLMNVIIGSGMRLKREWFEYQPAGFNARKMVVATE